jgi:tellurite resistance protein TerC
MYFALAGVIDLFEYLHYGLSVVLIFIGLKMLLSEHIVIPTAVALGVVIGVLAIAVAASMLFPKENKARDTAA